MFSRIYSSFWDILSHGNGAFSAVRHTWGGRATSTCWLSLWKLKMGTWRLSLVSTCFSKVTNNCHLRPLLVCYCAFMLSLWPSVAGCAVEVVVMCWLQLSDDGIDVLFHLKMVCEASDWIQQVICSQCYIGVCLYSLITVGHKKPAVVNWITHAYKAGLISFHGSKVCIKHVLCTLF